MAALQQATASSYGSTTPRKADVVVPDQFPVWLRVLVVDDDVTCLRILEKMLRRCMYIVMSADGRTNAVMMGIRHGACDYLIKPIREEELKNIWQHVARKKWNENKEHEYSMNLIVRNGEVMMLNMLLLLMNIRNIKNTEKRRDVKEEEDCELENDDPTTSKRPRVVWSVELHQQFVSAVNQLGIDKAVPKRILELMNVPGLTRENVASHLQNFVWWIPGPDSTCKKRTELKNITL